MPYDRAVHLSAAATPLGSEAIGMADASWIPWKRSAPKKGPPAPRSTGETRARLSLVVLVYFLAVLTVVTLAPFNFYIPNFVHVEAFGGWSPTISSALLF